MITKERLVNFITVRINLHPDTAVMVIADTKAEAEDIKRQVLVRHPLALIYAISTGGQTYGCRSDLIVMYNCINEKNEGDYFNQLKWYFREVRTRLNPKGEVIMIDNKPAIDGVTTTRNILLVGGPKHGETTKVGNSYSYYGEQDLSKEYEIAQTYRIEQTKDGSWYGVYVGKK